MTALQNEAGYKDLLSDGYTLTETYPYLSSDGTATLYWRIRLDCPGKDKEIRPVRDLGNGKYELKEPAFKKGKPLYNQHLLTQYPEAQVWVVEGEKCTNNLNAFFVSFDVFGQHIAVTPGGARCIKSADHKPLIGRKVIIWPDHDEPGSKFQEELFQSLLDKKTKADVIRVDTLDLPEGGDCVDWLEMNPDAGMDDLLRLPLVTNFGQSLGLDLVCMSDIDMQCVHWLWPNRIALGKISLIVGHPGLGKSQISAAIAAALTRGESFPGHQDEPPIKGSVILLSSEDDPEDTIKPRLVAAGADVTQCYFLSMVRLEDKRDSQESWRSFDLSSDVTRVERLLTLMPDVRLIIIDPITAYMGDVDSHNNAQIRGLIAPWIKLAKEANVAIIALTHFNKTSQQDHIERVIGSIGLPAAARAVHGVFKDKEDDKRRYFLPLKNNLGIDHTGYAYHIEPVTLESNDGEPLKTSKIIWEEEISVKDVLYPEPEKKPTQINGAKEFLTEQLAEGPRLASELFEEAEAVHYPKPTIQRAKLALGIQHKKAGFKGGGIWFWEKDRERALLMIKAMNSVEEREEHEEHID